jgi:hypothetical protein
MPSLKKATPAITPKKPRTSYFVFKADHAVVDQLRKE